MQALSMLSVCMQRVLVVCMVLEWTPEEASLLQDPRPFSAAASVYISREAWEAQTFSSISELRTRGQETLYETCACIIHNSCIRYMRYSTIDLSLLHLKRASEIQNHLTFSYWVPEHQGTGYFMRSECIKLVLVLFTLLTHCQLHVALVLVNLT